MSNVLPVWRLYFSPHEDNPHAEANTRNNQVMDKVHEILKDRTIDDCVNMLARKPTLPILFMSKTGNLSVAFHHRLFSDDDADPDVTLVSIVDTDHRTNPVEIDTTELFAETEVINCPTDPNLLKAKSSKDLNEFRTSASATFQGRNSIAVPPIMAFAVMNCDNTKPNEALPDVVTCLNSFDNLKLKDMPKAKKECIPALRWIYAAGQGKISAVTITPTVRNAVLQYGIDLDEKYLGRPRSRINDEDSDDDDSTGDKAQLTRVLDRLAKSAESSIDLQKKASKEAKTNRYAKLPQFARHILCYAQVEEDEQRVPTKPSKDMSQVLEQTSVSMVRAHLSLTLNNNFGAHMNTSGALASALHSGNILREYTDLPGTINLFFLIEAPAIGPSTGNQSTEQHLRATEGKGLSEKDIKELSHTNLTAVNDFVDLASRIENGIALYTLMFTNDSPIVSMLKEALEEIEKNKAVFKSKINGDKSFATEFLYRIDTKIDRFLRRCATATSRSKVDDGVLAIDRAVESVLEGDFKCNLPLLLQNLVKGGEVENDELEADQSSGGKRKKGNQDKRGKRITNEATRPKDWDLDGSEYGKMFNATRGWDDVPSVSGKQVCCKFQTRGFCFKECDRYHGTLSGDTKKAFSKCIEVRRSENSD